jgi:hypothetical protein
MDELLSIIGMCLLILFLVAMCAPQKIGEAGRAIQCGFNGDCPSAALEVKP